MKSKVIRIKLPVHYTYNSIRINTFVTFLNSAIITAPMYLH